LKEYFNKYLIENKKSLILLLGLFCLFSNKLNAAGNGNFKSYNLPEIDSIFTGEELRKLKIKVFNKYLIIHKLGTRFEHKPSTFYIYILDDTNVKFNNKFYVSMDYTIKNEVTDFTFDTFTRNFYILSKNRIYCYKNLQFNIPELLVILKKQPIHLEYFVNHIWIYNNIINSTEKSFYLTKLNLDNNKLTEVKTIDLPKLDREISQYRPYNQVVFYHHQIFVSERISPKILVYNQSLDLVQSVNLKIPKWTPIPYELLDTNITGHSSSNLNKIFTKFDKYITSSNYDYGLGIYKVNEDTIGFVNIVGNKYTYIDTFRYTIMIRKKDFWEQADKNSEYIIKNNYVNPLNKLKVSSYFLSNGCLNNNLEMRLSFEPVKKNELSSPISLKIILITNNFILNEVKK
jgi:hypothetical protein